MFSFLTLQANLKKESLNICVDPDWYPYEKLTPEGEYIGIAAELIAFITQEAGLNYTIIKTKNWEESIEFSKKGKCDVLSFLNQTPKRDTWLVFSEPYFTDQNVIITKEGHDYITNLAELAQESIALPKGSSILEKVRKDFPNLTIIETVSEEEAFSLVAQSKADLTLRSLTMAIYTIKQKGFFNLKVAGEVDAYANHLRMGIIKEKADLKKLLNKGIEAITPKKLREITNKHVAIKVEKRTNLKDFFIYFAGFLVFLFIIVGFALYLRRVNKRLFRLTLKLQHQIQKQQQIKKSLLLVNQRYESLIEGSREGIIVSQKYKIIFANPYFLELTKYTMQELSQKNIESFLHQEDRERAMDNHIKRLANANPETRYPARFLTKDDKEIWVEISGTIIEWDGEPATLNFIVDITQRVKNEKKMSHMAHHDALTGLANRWLMDERVEQQIALCTRTKSKFSLLFVDLNKFKPINDTYGHEAGDTVLKTVAQRLKKILRECDTIARIGGDEYIILLPLAQDKKSASTVIEKITKTFEEPFLILEHKLYLTCSIGLVLFPDDGVTKDALYTASDSLMYKDKNHL